MIEEVSKKKSIIYCIIELAKLVNELNQLLNLVGVGDTVILMPTLGDAVDGTVAVRGVGQYGGAIDAVRRTAVAVAGRCSPVLLDLPRRRIRSTPPCLLLRGCRNGGHQGG
jgi:hypothetical protein